MSTEALVARARALMLALETADWVEVGAVWRWDECGDRLDTVVTAGGDQPLSAVGVTVDEALANLVASLEGKLHARAREARETASSIESLLSAPAPEASS